MTLVERWMIWCLWLHLILNSDAFVGFACGLAGGCLGK